MCFEENDSQNIVIGGCVLICFFLEMLENSKVYPKVKLRRLELPNLLKFPIESGFPRILKLRKIEYELKLIMR